MLDEKMKKMLNSEELKDRKTKLIDQLEGLLNKSTKDFISRLSFSQDEEKKLEESFGKQIARIKKSAKDGQLVSMERIINRLFEDTSSLSRIVNRSIKQKKNKKNEQNDQKATVPVEVKLPVKNIPPQQVALYQSMMRRRWKSSVFKITRQLKSLERERLLQDQSIEQLQVKFSELQQRLRQSLRANTKLTSFRQKAMHQTYGAVDAFVEEWGKKHFPRGDEKFYHEFNDIRNDVLDYKTTQHILDLYENVKALEGMSRAVRAELPEEKTSLVIHMRPTITWEKLEEKVESFKGDQGDPRYFELLKRGVRLAKSQGGSARCTFSWDSLGHVSWRYGTWAFPSRNKLYEKQERRSDLFEYLAKKLFLMEDEVDRIEIHYNHQGADYAQQLKQCAVDLIKRTSPSLYVPIEVLMTMNPQRNSSDMIIQGYNRVCEQCKRGKKDPRSSNHLVDTIRDIVKTHYASHSRVTRQALSELVHKPRAQDDKRAWRSLTVLDTTRLTSVIGQLDGEEPAYDALRRAVGPHVFDQNLPSSLSMSP